MSRNYIEQNNCIALMNRLEQYHPTIAAAIYHVPNESKTRQNIDIGIKAGQPDYCLPIAAQGYNALYIEMKRADLKEKKNGGLSERQIKRQQQLILCGGCCVTCHSWEEAIGVILEYLGVNK